MRAENAGNGAAHSRTLTLHVAQRISVYALPVLRTEEQPPLYGNYSRWRSIQCDSMRFVNHTHMHMHTFPRELSGRADHKYTPHFHIMFNTTQQTRRPVAAVYSQMSAGRVKRIRRIRSRTRTHSHTRAH